MADNWLQHQKEAMKLAKDCLQASLDDQVLYADRSRKDNEIRQGDHVLVYKDYMSTPISRDQPCAKLKPRWYGPFKVLDTPTRTTARLDLPTGCRAHPVFNRSALKLYHSDTTVRDPIPPPPRPVIDADGYERYIVETVLSEPRFRGKKQYLVKWKGYQDPTWEPEHFLFDEAGQAILPLQLFLTSQH